MLIEGFIFEDVDSEKYPLEGRRKMEEENQMKILCALLFAGILFASVTSSDLLAADVKVLFFVDVVIAARLNPLRPVLEITSAAGKTIEYTETDAIEDEKGKLGDYDIVWLGFNAVSDNGNSHIAGLEQDLLDFTQAGGMVFSESGDDDGFQDKWLPSPVTCVEDIEHMNAEPGDGAGNFFESPNKVDLTAIGWDDNFIDYDEAAYTVLAQNSANGRGEMLMIKNGKGVYIVTAIDTRVTSEDLDKLLENVLTFFISALAVEPVDKLPVLWGDIKSN